MAAESWWCWLSSGTACFLFFNALVGVVAVLSWGRGGDATLSTRRKRLTRSASSMVMERLRSLSTMFSFQYPAADYDYDSIAPPASQLHHTPQEEGEETRQAVSDVEPEPAVPVAESMAATTMAPRTPSTPVAVAGAEVCAAASTLGGGEREEAETREEMSTPGAAAAAKGAAALRKWKVAGIVERRAYAEMEDKAEVNARAEQFIRQFREDLKLERLNSVLNSAPAP